MGLYDDIPPPGSAKAEEKGENKESVEESTTAAANADIAMAEESQEDTGKSEESANVSPSLYDGLKTVEKVIETHEGQSSGAEQPQRLNLKFLSRPKATKGKASAAQQQQQQQQEHEKPSLVPPTLQRPKRPRQTASQIAAKRQRSTEGVTKSTPVVHKVRAVPTAVQRKAEERVEDEYEPLHPNTYAEYLIERQKRAAMALQEDHDRAALLALAKNIESGGNVKASETAAADVAMVEATVGEADVDLEGDAVMAGDEEAPPKENFAERMMKKMGWKQGQGLGPDGTGMVKPLEAKRTAAGAGLIVNPSADERAAKYAADSPVLLLENMVESMAAADTDLQTEVKEECERIGGKVEQILVTADMKNNPRIFVVFSELSAAKKVLHSFHGRFFAGREVSVRHYSKQQFERRQYIL